MNEIVTPLNRPSDVSGTSPSAAASPSATPRPNSGVSNARPIPGVKHVIAVASGKGGVGKSTVALNLAIALSSTMTSQVPKRQARVALVDADIYGPSQPTMLGLTNFDEIDVRGDKGFVPMTRFGIQTMSMGYLVDAKTPMVWRGPMVGKALLQMCFQTSWDDVDYLIIDLPPGTGDTHLSLMKQVQVDGAVIVTTPQDLVLPDVQKGIGMFQKLDVPVLGIVENMSMHVCGQCGHESALFGLGGAETMAAEFGIELLASIPLDLRLRAAADAGEPIAVSEPSSDMAKLFESVAKKITSTVLVA